MKYNFPLFGEWLYDTLRRLRLAHYRICSSAGLGSNTLQRIFRGMALPPLLPRRDERA